MPVGTLDCVYESALEGMFVTDVLLAPIAPVGFVERDWMTTRDALNHFWHVYLPSPFKIRP